VWKISIGDCEMSELISGWQAIKAVEDGELVEYQKMSSKWYSLNDEKGKWIVSDFTCGSYKFRIKPRTIMIGDVEVPAPFEPKEGERYFYIYPSSDYGYGEATTIRLTKYIQFGAWRSESEIEQVVAALRKLFKGE
jgi:hypothetical protein